ncbi:hypothetical protein CR513_12951, partial [Mucuna pruriens]
PQWRLHHPLVGHKSISRLTQIPTHDSSAAQIHIKLDDTNYALWSQVVKMFILGKDKLGLIETYYNNLQGLWGEIDFKQPNPMTCEIDIRKFNSIIQEDWVYIFLDGLDD